MTSATEPAAGAPDRREADVARLLGAGAPAPLPPDLAARAALCGARLAHRRRVAVVLAWLLALAAATALAAWALSDPWAPPPAEVTPHLGW